MKLSVLLILKEAIAVKQLIDLLIKAQQEKLQADLKAAYIDQNNDPHFWSEFELWDSTVGDGLDQERSPLS